MSLYYVLAPCLSFFLHFFCATLFIFKTSLKHSMPPWEMIDSILNALSLPSRTIGKMITIYVQVLIEWGPEFKYLEDNFTHVCLDLV